MKSPVAIAHLAAPVAARLERAPFVAGRVHSVFTRCVNVAWHDGRLVAFHAPGPLAAPFAASLTEAPDLGAIRAGDLVRHRAGTLRLGPLEVATDGAAVVDCSLPPSAGSPEVVVEALAALGPLPHAPALGSSAALAAQGALAAAIQDGLPRQFAAAAQALIGLGEGLTPAGDDCLVGALAALRRFGTPGLLDAPARAELRRAVPAATTAIGGEFILHALDGAFAELIVALLTADEPDSGRRAAAGLARVGATSGADTLAGIRLALEALGAHRT